MAQVVECLPRMHKPLGVISSTERERERQRHAERAE
jgi:hypothetical protein